MQNRTKIFFLISFGILVLSFGIGLLIGFFGMQKERRYELPLVTEAISGTLIGAKRNLPAGPMQWDDDMDMMAAEENINENLDAMLNDPDFNRDLDYMYSPYCDCVQFKAKKFLHVGKEHDLDLFYLRKGEKVSHFKYWLPRFPKEGFFNEDDFAPEPCKFWGKETYCPKDWKRHLNDAYGDDWHEIAYKWNHGGIGIEKGKERVNLTLLENKKDLIPMIPPSLVEKLYYKPEI